ncbi:MAG: hypothetical protein ACQEQF_11035 [Bacillota bacterium]
MKIMFNKEQKNEFFGRLLSFVSRKFVLAVFIMIISSIMVFKAELSPETWLIIAAGDVLTYNFSNAYSKKHKN